ncbi:MAG: hypothetical protein ACI87N_000561 [Flavobacteriales bacterium]|jgi:hypothetical protein
MKNLFLILLSLFVLPFSIQASTYYLDADNGNDNNDGISTQTSWKSLAKISTTALSPGDIICFKKGNRFNGHFVVNGSGSSLNPITITAYGSGAKPIITGEVGAAGGGDYQEAIYIMNQDNIIIDGLEINNERLATRSGIDDKTAFGIYIYNSGTQIMRNFIIRNMTFQNVYATQPMLLPEDFNNLEVAAVRFYTTKNTVSNQVKNIQNVLVENCYFTDLQRLGVHIKHAGGNTGIGTDSSNRNRDFIFRNNNFDHIGGTCILPSMTYNCLIENNIFNYPGDNSDPRMPNRGSSVWTWRSYNTVIQYNQCLHVRGYLDSHGIHIDHENVNTFIQYNYMEDCEGGFVEILGGNVNAVYRFNVSVNDGWRENPSWANSNHTIWINENASASQIIRSDYSYIYNNTIVISNPFSTAIDIDGTNTHIYNNIFYTTNGGNIGGKQVAINNNLTPPYIRNNLFRGTIASAFKSASTNNQTGDPKFYQLGSGDKNGYQLNFGSAAIDKGVAKQGPPIPGAGIGIFENVPAFATVDFYGNSIDMSSGTPNIGACNAKNEETLANKKFELKTLLYPNPVKNVLNISEINTNVNVKIYNCLGQLTIEKNTTGTLDVSTLKPGQYFIKVEDRKAISFFKI